MIMLTLSVNRLDYIFQFSEEFVEKNEQEEQDEKTPNCDF